MYKNLRKFSDFCRRVEILWADAFADRELEESPCDVFGGFRSSRIDEFLRVARLHPEYHIVTCIGPELYINAFVKGALAYQLAEGDADPKLIYDPYDVLDAHFLQSLNSGRKSRRA